LVAFAGMVGVTLADIDPLGGTARMLFSMSLMHTAPGHVNPILLVPVMGAFPSLCILYDTVKRCPARISIGVTVTSPTRGLTSPAVSTTLNVAVAVAMGLYSCRYI